MNDGARKTLTNGGRLASVGKKRTRTGCLNCRQKRRKCDEGKPVCEACRGRRERCTYGLKLSFRPENALTMGNDHPSMRSEILQGRPQNYQIVDITSEVIRDFVEETGEINQEANLKTKSSINKESQHEHQNPIFHPRNINPITPTATKPSPFNPATPAAFDLFLSPTLSDSTSAAEDGIFIPGSQYHELHSTLRNRIIHTARSPHPSSPNPAAGPSSSPSSSGEEDEADALSRHLAHLSADQELHLWQNYLSEVSAWLDKFDNSRSFGFTLPVLAKSHPHLNYAILALSARQIELKAGSKDHSCSLALYQRAIHLLSPLLEQRTTVVLASCIVLCVLEMLSCSPKAWKRHLDGCAALIQAMGISGTSRGGVERGLFWCFARMDVCGGLISCERTLIPLGKWIGARGGVVEDVEVLAGMERGRFDVCANHMVYLCGQVVDLLCASGKWDHRSARNTGSMAAGELTQRWSVLYWLLDRWYRERPDEMKPLLSVPSPPNERSKPFPILLYGNGPAVSGNQMYHTAALLMLKHKPSDVHFAIKPRSILWHARQICGISVSNNHHGCWTNSIQPLWIAGQHMSHASEHNAIIEIYDRIERETGWATRWRQDDLREYWGDVDS